MFSHGASSKRGLRSTPSALTVQDVESPLSSHEVQNIWAMRRSRAAFFPAGLFADPAWDMLLYLYAAKLAGQRSSVKDAVFGSNVPEATALRWIARLAEAGLCSRRADPLDRRRQFIELTPEGMDTMARYFEAVHGGKTGTLSNAA